MQYMLLIYESPDATADMSEEESAAYMGEYFAYTDALREAGALVAGDALHPAASATSVRVRDGETLTTDGPFAETRETLGGYYLVDVGSAEEAAAWAARIPSARHGTIEVREVVVFDQPAA